eukprot:CAMPEP_0175042830 /NCGR_PEP_ID=MMETSP0052_2-20121109/2806_1 /TAXON_ID=51329 ORGANISM="Polytomella parva, Strain SAG 63-3" /NCGR_SAMPLE_ID=MMETSP0052_2 /ASSEMBLY_ACC=CAM_ASM_000194 /LENGTH=279 /DNA_ID=CAMNT_0016305735 /DNA_START=1 /DNA_END=840 /DNA_ORIENTATION=+
MNFNDEFSRFEAELEAVEKPSSSLNSYKSNGYNQPKPAAPNKAPAPIIPRPVLPPASYPPVVPPPLMYVPQPYEAYGYTDPSQAYPTNAYVSSSGAPPINPSPYSSSTNIPSSQPSASIQPNPSANRLIQTTRAPVSKGGKASKGLFRMAGGEKWFDPTLETWPENDFRIFVGDLGNEVNDETLTRAFSKYSSFAKAKVVRDSRSKKSKGFGFVSFLDGNDFAKALREMNGKYIGNRPCKLTKSNWNERCPEAKRPEAEVKVNVGHLSGRKVPKSVLHK